MVPAFDGVNKLNVSGTSSSPCKSESALAGACLTRPHLIKPTLIEARHCRCVAREKYVTRAEFDELRARVHELEALVLRGGAAPVSVSASVSATISLATSRPTP